MTAYLHSIWRCRYFWLSLVRIDLRTRYRQSVWGLVWTFIQPLTLTAIFCYIVRPLIMPDRPIIACALFFLIGLACWQFLTNVTIQGCTAILRGEPYIRQYPTPLAIWPLRTTLTYGVHWLIVLCPLTLVSCLWHHDPGICLVLLLPAIVFWMLFAWSLAVLVSIANVYYQDTQHFCEVGLQVAFYLSPILYAPDLLEARGIGGFLWFNPLTHYLAMIRQPLLELQPASPAAYLWAAAITAALLAFAVTALTTQRNRVIFYM